MYRTLNVKILINNLGFYNGFYLATLGHGLSMAEPYHAGSSMEGHKTEQQIIFKCILVHGVF